MIYNVGDEDEDAGYEHSQIPRVANSIELGLEGGGADEHHEVDSHAEEVGAIPRRRCIHIMHEGQEVDSNGGVSRKHPLGVGSP